MTEEEAYDQLYFGIRLYVEDVLRGSTDVLYNDPSGPGELPDNINSGVPRTLSYTDAQGRTVSMEIKGGPNQTSGTFERFCTLTLPGMCWTKISVGLNQVITASTGDYSSTGDYGIVLTTDMVDVINSRLTGGATVREFTPELVDAWQACTINNAINFGGIIEARIKWPTGLLIRNGAGTGLLRGDTVARPLVDA